MDLYYYYKTVRLWDAATGRETAKLEGHTHVATSVWFSPDATSVVVTDTTGRRLAWDPATAGVEPVPLGKDPCTNGAATVATFAVAAAGAVAWASGTDVYCRGPSSPEEPSAHVRLARVIAATQGAFRVLGPSTADPVRTASDVPGTLWVVTGCP